MSGPIYSMPSEKNNDATVRAALTQHLKGIWRYGLSLSGRADVADDLAQATCVRALERVHQVTSDRRLDAWFMTICRSIWLNELRSQTIRRAQSLDAEPGLELIAQDLDTETNYFATEVFTEVMALPEAQREVVILVYVQGYTYRETAEIMEVPIGTVMSRLHAARGKLQALDGKMGQVEAGQ